MKRDQIISYFFVGLFLFILYQLILIFSPFAGAASWAAILAFAFYPLYLKIQTLPRISPSVSALIATALVVLIVVIPAAYIVVSLMQEAIELYSRLSNYILTGDLERFIEQVKQSNTAEWAQQFWAFLNPLQKDLTDTVLEVSKRIGNFAGLQLATFTKNVFLWTMDLFLTAFLLFFFFRDGKAMYQFLYKMVPMPKKNKQILAKRIDETLGAVIRGQFVTSLVQGTMAGVVFWLLGLPLPFFFGFLTFLTTMIPITGAATVWAPFATYLLLDKQIEKGIALTLIGFFIISLSDNILKSMLIGEKTKLPIFLLFLGILGSIQLYGFTGIFLGPIVLALFFALTKIFREEYQTEDD